MLYPINKNNIDVQIINGNPYITINLDFIGRVYSMDTDLKYLDDSVLKNLSKKTDKYLNEILTSYLYKTSLDFKSDINDFGRFASKNFITIPEFKNYNWKENYTNTIFRVNTHTEIKSGFLVTET